MVRNGEMTLEDARRVFRRYWWIAPMSAVACTALAVVLATILPKQYTSQMVVLIDEPTVPQEYVKPVVSGNNQRLASMQERILSSSRLQLVIDQARQYGRVVSFLGRRRYTGRLHRGVPEPSSFALAAVGAAALLGYSIRRRRRAAR